MRAVCSSSASLRSAGVAMSSGSTPFVANVVRRTWDLSEYEEKAKEKARLEAEAESAADAKKRNAHHRAQQQAVVVRAPLKHRETDVALESRLGKRSVVTSSTPLSGRGGYYCSVCDCSLKDSITYLDHINGKKHQRALGMTLRAERSTLGEVKAKLEDHKRRSEEANSGSELEQRLARFQDEVDMSKRARKEAKREEEARRAEAAQRAEQAEAQFTLGATSSEARKRKRAPESKDGAVEDEADADDDDERDGKKPRSAPSSAAAAAAASSVAPAADDEDPEAAMMRAMGFSTGFAKGKNK